MSTTTTTTTIPVPAAETADAPRARDEKRRTKERPLATAGGTEEEQLRALQVMIGVPTPGLYLGHSMPPTLKKSPILNIYTKI